jgi:hypothetical protein
MASLSRKQLTLIGCLLGSAYGIFARFAFGLGWGRLGNVFEVMTGSFIFGVPVALGFITVWFGEYREKYGWGRRILTPWLSSAVCLFCCLLFMWEGLLCVWLWLPLVLVLVLSSLGGLLAGLLRLAFPSKRGKTFCVSAIALMPFLAAPIESLRADASEVRRVHTAIEIDASHGVVWEQIRSVPKILPAEHSFSVSHLLGFPRPIDAVLEGVGIGVGAICAFRGRGAFHRADHRVGGKSPALLCHPCRHQKYSAQYV